jgi:hypothetical protein
MPITKAIRDAATEHEIFFLLTAYVEAVRYCDKLDTLPPAMKNLPITGANDVVARMEALRAGLSTSPREEHVVIREALEIFGAALLRLGSLATGNTIDLPIAA